MPGIGLRQLGGEGDKLRALIVTGQTDIHHDWRTISPMLAELLRDTGLFDVRITEEFRGAGPETLDQHVVAPEHAITAGMPEFLPHYDDDLYVNLEWAPGADVEVLVKGWDNPLRYTQVPEEWAALPGMGEEHPLVWTNRFGEGRVFATGIGHGPEAVSHPSFRGLFARGAEWAATGQATVELPEGFGEPVPGGDWWPTTLEPMVRDMYEQRKQGAQ